MLPAIKDPLGAAAVAHIENKENKQGRYVRILTIRRHNDTCIPVSLVLPKYDMGRLLVTRPNFYCSDFDEELYKECLKSKKGRHLVNVLKNERTLKIVNEWTEIFDGVARIDPVKFEKGQPCKLKIFLHDLIESPLEAEDQHVENLLSHKILNIRNEEIWKMFKKTGLVEEIKSLKKQSYESHS